MVFKNLKDLCLEGTLAPELGNLVHVKSIVLRNNSFSGLIPKEIEALKDLEFLDLGYNNFSGALPVDLGSNLSLTILLLDNNNFIRYISPELLELWKLSEIQVAEKRLSITPHGESCHSRSFSWNTVHSRDIGYRRLLQLENPPASNKEAEQNNSQLPPSPSPSPSASPSPSPSSYAPSPAPTGSDLPPPSRTPAEPPVVIAPPPSANPSHGSGRGRTTMFIVSGAVGAAALISILSLGILVLRGNKTVIVKPWATGLSGQLQKAFVTGVPKLKRSELETACEDFSNIISSSSDDTVYKGTLSTGVEIAVTSTTVKSSKEWSKHLEEAFRKKIDTLSKVNHKNFVNILGFCEEEEPFTRMIVFEYAPNGTLFEHLHIKESEHLDWGVRLRIAMGIAYCLEHMHQLTPPVVHKKLHSSSIYLTEDYAGKISDFGFWNEATMAKMRSTGIDDTPSTDPETNIYSFGVILLEMITGRLSNSLDDGPLVAWASEFLGRRRRINDMVDPTLKTFQEEDLEKLCEIVTSCVHSDPNQRPSIREVTARLREITLLPPDRATPRLSPLWWAELEILSTEAS
ncbi:hypothetical protein AQUCO_00400428v1 [Aquilegia coerulea]|uniref:Protein kinase domain-containing protein n=1 Tax=Aquilegia coerulea TaxID=218851 RepID=A0A2G5EUW6_AQUCA|nr:hypothetical protein AQUCO_00400428v1 [Aquilegia coerulea]